MARSRSTSYRLSSLSFSCLLELAPHNAHMSSSAYKPKFGYDIRIRPETPLRAPKSRHNMDDRQWLCREHLRQHNERWNYFAGMSENEIERFCLDAITGH